MSWRAGLLLIAADRKTSLTDRLHAVKVLIEAGDPGVPRILRSLVNALPDLAELPQRDVVDFLVALDTPLARELLVSIASNDRLSDAVRRSAVRHPSVRATPEDPEDQVFEDRPRRADPPPARSIVKKRETGEGTFFTIPTILAGGVTAVLLVLLGVEVLRKG
ncbi:MAG TPA: hypothetical protein VMU54_15265, partial [Planctomycetota bacterium]|nr:hypothetical protein [Planctomycetota bacterium]